MHFGRSPYGRETVRIHQGTKLILAFFSFPNSCKITEKRLLRRRKPTKTKTTQEITTRPVEKKKGTSQLVVVYATDPRKRNANCPVMTAER